MTNLRAHLGSGVTAYCNVQRLSMLAQPQRQLGRCLKAADNSKGRPDGHANRINAGINAGDDGTNDSCAEKSRKLKAGVARSPCGWRDGITI